MKLDLVHSLNYIYFYSLGSVQIRQSTNHGGILAGELLLNDHFHSVKGREREMLQY